MKTTQAKNRTLAVRSSVAFILSTASLIAVLGVGCGSTNLNDDGKGNAAAASTSSASTSASTPTTSYDSAIQITSAAKSFTTGVNATFTATGGSAPYTYSLVSPSVGSIVSTTGVYTPGATAGAATILVTDSTGLSNVLMIEVFAPTHNPYALASAEGFSVTAAGQTLDELIAASNVLDNNPATFYSSGVFPTSANTRQTQLVVYLPAISPVSSIVLRARMSNGVAQAFPAQYSVYITNSTNSAFILLGTITTQPNASGIVTVNLPAGTMTKGVLIAPEVLGVDGDGNHYFQMADVLMYP